jgi:hypothetical protein
MSHENADQSPPDNADQNPQDHAGENAGQEPRSAEQLAADIRVALAGAVDTLTSAGARDEAHGTYIAPHKVLFFTKDAALAPAGRVWRLGVFLLGRDGTLFATGTTTRAVEPGRPGYQSESAEERRAYRAAALKGRFTAGETVNFDAVEIATDATNLSESDGPLFLRAGRALVRWNASVTDEQAIDFESYLAERISLLIDPPGGA